MWLGRGRDGWRIFEGGTGRTLPVSCCEEDDDDDICLKGKVINKQLLEMEDK